MAQAPLDVGRLDRQNRPARPGRAAHRAGAVHHPDARMLGGQLGPASRRRSRPRPIAPGAPTRFGPGRRPGPPPSCRRPPPSTKDRTPCGPTLAATRRPGDLHPAASSLERPSRQAPPVPPPEQRGRAAVRTSPNERDPQAPSGRRHWREYRRPPPRQGLRTRAGAPPAQGGRASVRRYPQATSAADVRASPRAHNARAAAAQV